MEEPTAVQTLNLSAGVNWVSTFVEITLADLQDALANALPGTQIMIQGMDGYTTYNGVRWRGSLNSLDVVQMYMITVASSCEITLEGMPIDPAEHPITIRNGVNWIGFPFQADMAISDAFAGFAVANDMVQGSEGYTTYNGTRWRGSLSNLVPGRGYLYNSAASENRTLVFPAPSKARKMKP